MKATLLMVAHDPGGADALSAIAARLEMSESWMLAYALAEPAESMFRAKTHSDIIHFNPDESLVEILEFLNSFQPDLVLTGTSFHASLEKNFILCCRHLSIPCMSLVDAWANMDKRFLVDEKKHEWAFPDVIGLVDEESKALFAGLPIDENQLQVVGQPALDEFLASLGKPGGAHEDGGIVFFSQPIRELSGAAHDSHSRGYDEYSVLGLVIQALKLIGALDQLVIKLHPKEARDKFDQILNENEIPLAVEDNQSADRLIISAKVVLGMTSIVLVKAFLARKPLVSLQPNRRHEDKFVLTQKKWIEPFLVDSPEVLAQRIQDCQIGTLPDISQVPSTWSDGKSFRRCLIELESLLSPQPIEVKHGRQALSSA